MAVTIDGSGEISGLDEINNIPLPTTGFGKVLQIVRATDSTDRSTTSTSYVDASISVTITPQISTSAVIVIASFLADVTGSGGAQLDARFTIADSSNNALSGAQDSVFYRSASGSLVLPMQLFGYVTPATTSAVTYKLRFRVVGANQTARLANAGATGQLYAIEVSA